MRVLNFATADGFTEYFTAEKIETSNSLLVCSSHTFIYYETFQNYNLVLVQVYFDIVSKSNSYVFPKVGLTRCLNGLLMKKLHFNHNNVTIAQRLFKEQFQF